VADLCSQTHHVLVDLWVPSLHDSDSSQMETHLEGLSLPENQTLSLIKRSLFVTKQKKSSTTYVSSLKLIRALNSFSFQNSVSINMEL
jgi:hypothetical protein